MDHRLISCFLFFLSSLAIALGYSILYDPSLFNLCPNTPGVNCLHEFTKEGIGRPLYETTYLFPILFFALIFVRKEAFSIWWKVFLPFALMGLFLVALSPAMPDLQLPDRMFMASRVVWVLFGLSVVTLGYAYVRIMRNTNSTLRF